MKNVTVNVQIQFDLYEDDPEKYNAAVASALDEMTGTLQMMHPDMSPVIFTNSLDSSDIEVHEDEDIDIYED